MDRPGRGKRVVVIGGGITGLTVSLSPHAGSPDSEDPLEVLLLEASGRLGGTHCDTPPGRAAHGARTGLFSLSQALGRASV